MTCLPQPSPIFRPPRVRMTDFTPAVLRFHDGGCATGSLEVISPTGGLLCLPKSAKPGSRVKLMFLTPMGPGLGSAQLLSPVSRTRQPFRFVGLPYGDERRLRAITPSLQSEAPSPDGE